MEPNHPDLRHEDAGNGSVVRYTVKELLAEIRVMIQEISRKLDSKADAETVSKLENRVSALEANTASKEAIDSYRRWAIPFWVFATCSLIGSAIALANTF